MPVRKELIVDTIGTIRRPVVVSVVKTLMQYTGLNYKNIEIQDSTHTPVTALPGSKTHDTGHSKDNQFDTRRKFMLGYTEQAVDSEVLATSVFWRNNPYIFVDPKLAVTLEPTYVRKRVNLTVEYRASSETEAEQWRNDILEKVSMERAELPMEVSYNYPIPFPLLEIIANIHTNREFTAGYGDTLAEYIANHAHKGLTTTTNPGGEQYAFTFAETQTEILGWFDFTHEVEVQRNNQNGTVTASFGFTFEYDQPIGMVLRYPMLVHNKYLDKKYLGNAIPWFIDESGAAMTVNMRAQRLIRGTRKQTWTHPIGGIVMPSIDDWIPSELPNYQQNLFTCTVIIDTNDPYLVGNIRNLPGFALKDIYVDYLLEKPREAFSLSRSPIAIFLFTGKDKWAAEDLTIDEKGFIRTTKAMDVRKVHHFMIAITTDLTTIGECYRERLRKNGKMFLEIVKAIAPYIPEHELPKLLGGKVISKLDYHDVMMKIRTTDSTYLTRENRCWFTVGSFLLMRK